MNHRFNEVFLEISSLVFSSLERDVFLEKVTERLSQSFCDFFYVILLDEKGEMRLHCSQKKGLPLNEQLEPESSSLLLERVNRQGPASVLRAGKSEILHIPKEESSSPANSGAYCRFMQKMQTPSSVCVPLLAGSETLGCLGFLNSSQSAVFNREDLVVLEEVAKLVAMAIRNANLHSQLRESEQKLALVANTVPAPIAYVDKSGALTYGNESFFSAFQACSSQPWPSHRQNGTHLKDLLPAQVYASVQECIGSGLRGTKTVESGFICPEKGERFLELTLAPQSGNSNNPGWFVLFIQDLTQIKHRQEELRRSKEEAEAASLAKSRFLTNMSHEIRTPLGSMLGFAELICGYGEDVATIKNWSSKIHSCGNHLLEIINNVLDLAKAEENKITVNPKTFRFEDFFQDLTNSFPASKKQVKLLFKSEINKDLQVRTDRTVLRQILFNIIGNALKFTDQGEVQVQAHCQKAGPFLNFFIIDTGPGMTEEETRKLFLPFSQLDSSDGRRHEGTGLGLALARKMARTLGGEVELDSSSPGKGTTFKVSVKVETFEGAPQQKPLVSPSLGNVDKLQGARIIVIDDSQDFRFLISSFFKLVGAHVEAYSSGSEALEDPFFTLADMAFLDLQMPQMDGYTVKRKMTERGFVKPIIACTANAMKEELEKTVSAGFSGYITKPLDMDKLIEVALQNYQSSGVGKKSMAR